MQNTKKQTCKRITTYNPVWWVVGFGALIVLVVGILFGLKPQEKSTLDVALPAVQTIKTEENEDNENLAYNPHHVILPEANYALASQLALNLGAELQFEARLNFALLVLPDGLTIDDIMLDSSYEAYWDEMDYDYYLTISDIPNYGEPGYMEEDLELLQTYLNFVNLQDAWDTTTGQGVTLAIIDTGIDTDNPEFEGRISPNSYNASSRNKVSNSDLSIIEDAQGHGTMVAGVAAAAKDGQGIVGIAPDVTLLVIKCNCNEKGQFTSSADLVHAIRYAADNGAQVINMSFGGASSNIFQSAIKYAADKGIICIAAAGNEKSRAVCYPASDVNCVSVGALAKNSYTLADYSNYGHTDICAPGSVYTTIVGGEFGSTQGTSFSSPITAAAVALYLQLDTGESRAEIINRLLNASLDVGALGRDYYFGCGALDITRFLFGETVNLAYQYEGADGTNTIYLSAFKNYPVWNVPEATKTGQIFYGWKHENETPLNYYRDIFSVDTVLYGRFGLEADVEPYLYVTLDDGTIEIRKYTGTLTNMGSSEYLWVPDELDGKTVSSIGGGAFDGRKAMYFLMPNGLTYLDLYFMGTTALGVGTDQTTGCNYLSSSNNPYLVLMSVPSSTDETITLNPNIRLIFYHAFVDMTNLVSVEIPAGVTYIGDYAFEDLSYLETVTIPNSVKYIGSYAFWECSSLKISTLPSAITALSDYLFYGCSSITSFTIPSSVQKMGAGVFADCTKLTSITIPNGVEEIPELAFYRCSALKTINLPQSVEIIHEYAFAGCRISGITLPDELKLAEKKAFMGSYLKSITLPANINVVSEGLFYGCGLMENIGFLGDIEIFEADCFNACGSLKSVTIPASAVRVAKGIFSNCTSIQTVIFITKAATENIAIPDNMFEDCTALISVQCECASISIGAYAFDGCTNLVSLAGFTDIDALGEGAFRDCSSLNMDFVFADDLVSVPRYAFQNCTSQTKELVFSAPLEYVGDLAFFHCPGLKEVVLADTVTDFGSGFRGATGLTSLVIPEGVTTLGLQALEECAALEEIALPVSLISISEYAFNKCTALKKVSVSPEAVLPNYVFYGCTALEEMEIPIGASLMFKMYFDGNSVPSTLKKLTINNNANIQHDAFSHCTQLETVIFSGWSVSLGANAFAGCTGITTFIVSSQIVAAPGSVTDFDASAYTVYDHVRYLTNQFEELVLAVGLNDTESTSISLHPNLRMIADEAFKDQTSLLSVTLPQTTDFSFGTDVFKGCSNLSVSYPCNLSSEKVALLTDENGPKEAVPYHNYPTRGKKHSATETTDGYTEFKCKSCSASYQTDYVPAFGRVTMHLIDPSTAGIETLQYLIRFEDEENSISYFKNITCGATVGELRSLLTMPECPVVTYADGTLVEDDDAPLVTGMVFTLYSDDEQVTDTVVIVVHGDASGDGVISITDLLMVKSMLLKKSTFDGAATLAADVSGDGNISITDFVQYKNHLLKKQMIELGGEE